MRSGLILLILGLGLTGCVASKQEAGIYMAGFEAGWLYRGDYTPRQLMSYRTPCNPIYWKVAKDTSDIYLHDKKVTEIISNMGRDCD